MKRLLLLVMACVSSFSNAESITPFEEGVYNLSGSISYIKYENNRDEKSTQFSVSPGVLYFISQRVAVGGRITYWRTSDDFFKYEAYGIAPAFRYYFTQNDSNPFVELNYGYSISKSGSGPNVDKRHSNTSGIIFGLDYFLAKNVAFEPSVSYWRYKNDDDGPSGAYENKTLTVGAGISVFIY